MFTLQFSTPRSGNGKCLLGLHHFNDGPDFDSIRFEAKFQERSNDRRTPQNSAKRDFDERFPFWERRNRPHSGHPSRKSFDPALPTDRICFLFMLKRVLLGLGPTKKPPEVMKIMPDPIHVLHDNFQVKYKQGLSINNKNPKLDFVEFVFLSCLNANYSVHCQRGTFPRV